MTEDEEITLVGGDGTHDNGFTPGGHTGATFAIPRLGLPAVHFTDGPVGVRQGKATAMPIPMALAATWDGASAYRAGRAVGTEAKDKGNDVVFGRSPAATASPRGVRRVTCPTPPPSPAARPARERRSPGAPPATSPFPCRLLPPPSGSAETERLFVSGARR